MVYKRSNKTYDFRKFKTLCDFDNEIGNDISDMIKANDEQNQLVKRINKFKSKTSPQNFESKK